MTDLDIVVSTAFGLEAVLSRELVGQGISDMKADNGKVSIRGDERLLCRLNIRLRTADRVFVKLASFPAGNFDDLFEGTKSIEWQKWLPVNAVFPVRGVSVKSKLHSVPACQSIVKKAIVDRLRTAYSRNWLPEDGPEMAIQVSLHNDIATILLDSSGVALHKRGYRRLVGDAPIRETIAAALVLLSLWTPERQLVDPFCGTGTIAIEAAMIGINRSPGIRRSFAAEDWPAIDRRLWTEERHIARSEERPGSVMVIQATDIDSKAISLARHHAKQADVERFIHIQQRDLKDFSSPKKYGCIICNPPYGERLSNPRQVEELFRLMGEKFLPLDTWSTYVISSSPDFEKFYGRKSDKRRKLYNGKIPCTYYQFFGPPPPRRTGKKISVSAPTED